MRGEPRDVGSHRYRSSPAAPAGISQGSRRLTTNEGASFTAEQVGRLNAIHERLIEARRELDALIGDAYLRPRASIVPVHFLDLASAVEKLRWAEKEWRELNESVGETQATAARDGALSMPEPEQSPPHHLVGVTAEGRRP